jgi:hypothetical protein
MEPESENRDLVHVEASSTPETETDTDIARLIRKVGTPSIAEIEKLIGELQETKNFLQSEGDRIERETARYMNLTQMASASVKIIFDTVSGWRQASLFKIFLEISKDVVAEIGARDELSKKIYRFRFGIDQGI